MRKTRPSYYTLAAVFIAAGVVYALISFVNHYLFRTYALDLGFYTHIMNDYAHFKVDDYFMFNRATLNVLSDHFDLYLIILSPLVYIFGSYTLLVVQLVAVLLGGWGVFKLIGLYTDDEWIPVLASAVFLSSFGIIHAFSFDYHSNVLTAMMLPWLLYYLKQRKFGLSTLFAVLFVIGKENMSLWLFFIALGLLWDYRKDKKAVWYLTGYAVFAMVYFFLINMVVMPWLGDAGGGFKRYAWLGSNYLDIAKNLITKPGNTLHVLFNNTSGWYGFDGIKAEFYYCALASGLILTLLKPNYLLMLVPLIAQKMLANEYVFWGIALHYNVEFVPVLVISSFLVIIKIKQKKWQYSLSGVLLLSVLLTTFYTITDPKTPIRRERLCIYYGAHYHQDDFDIKYARHLMELIPEDAYVCAASMFVPHLARREYIEDFEWNKNTEAEYVLIPQSYFELREYGGDVIFGNKDDFEVVETDGTLYLMKVRGRD